MPVSVGAGTAYDHDFAVATARRFAAFGPPAWRTSIELVEGEVRCLDDYFEGRMPRCELLVAERDGGSKLEKGRELGVATLDEAEMVELIINK